MSDSEDDNLRPPRKKSKWINSDSESDFVKEDNSTDEFDTDEDSIVKRKASGASRQVDSTSEEILDSESESESDSESDEYDSENDPDRDPTAIKVLSDDESSSDDSVDRYESEMKESANFQEDITQNEIEDGNDSSSSGDENSECCAICLSKLSPQKLPSMPDADGCDHKFCRECIVQWSKQTNTCPLDRKPFEAIIIFNRIGGNEIAREKCKPERPEEVIIEDEDERRTLCERCGCGDRADVLLLCDGCDLGYHMDCLVPSISRVPRGRWYCPTCESSGLISDYLTQRPRATIEDPLPRTIENVRIRGIIQRTILQVSSGVGAVPRRNPTTTKRKTTKKRKSPTKKRKTTKRKSTTARTAKKSTRGKKGTKAKRKSTSGRRKSSKKSRKSVKRKVGQPKRALSSFFLWMQENRAKIKSENPELSLGELSSKAGEIWRTISDSDKSVWDAKAAEDRRRYKLEMKRWESEQSSKKSSKYSKKSQENTSKFSKDSSSASGIIPDFQLYGNANDLLWFGDDEELYANPKPSTSSNNSGPISRSEAAKIIKDSKEKPVAKVKPMFRTTEEPVSHSPNLLGDILSRQNDFFKPTDKSNIVPKEPKKSENPPKKSKTNNPALIKRSSQSSIRKPLRDEDGATESSEPQTTTTTSCQKTVTPTSSNSNSNSRRTAASSTSSSSSSSLTLEKKISSKFTKEIPTIDLTARSQNIQKSATNANTTKKIPTIDLTGNVNNLCHKRKETNASTTTTTNSIQNTVANSNTTSGNTKILSKPEKAALMERAEDKVKTYLKPFFARGLICKESYKHIMRKCVEKVYEKSKLTHIKDEKISQLVESYVSKLS